MAAELEHVAAPDRGRGGPREVVEAALAQTVRNPTEAAYARSDLFERRRRLMDDWASDFQGACNSSPDTDGVLQARKSLIMPGLFAMKTGQSYTDL